MKKLLTLESWPLETNRWMESEIEFLAFWRAPASLSRRNTSEPATAASWAIPAPIWPAPITPITLNSAMKSIIQDRTWIGRWCDSLKYKWSAHTSKNYLSFCGYFFLLFYSSKNKFKQETPYLLTLIQNLYIRFRFI